MLAFATTLLASGLIAIGDRWAMAAGGLGVLLGSALDGVDGELARVSGRASRRGAALDTLLDRYADLAVVVGLVIGAGHTETAWAWGFAAGCGCPISYIHAVGRDTDVRLLFRREVRLLIFALAAISGLRYGGWRSSPSRPTSTRRAAWCCSCARCTPDTRRRADLNGGLGGASFRRERDLR